MSSSSSAFSHPHRTLEITLISAKDLKNVNFTTKLAVYAILTLSGDQRTRRRTPTDREGGKNPSWNCSLRFQIPAGIPTDRLFLDVYLRCERALGDRDVGEVHVPVKELESASGSGMKFVSYQVRRASGKAKGVLNFSYKFSEVASVPVATAPANAVYPPPPRMTKEDEPVMAYPVGGAGAGKPFQTYQPYPASTSSVPYPPPAGYPQSQSYGYGGGYGGYGQGGGGYGYAAPPPVVLPQRPPKKNKFGFGTGLLGGVLGGLLIGDILSDSSAYDAGYDAGFDDYGDFGGGGFDF